jgi:hypothetical protein
MKKQQLVLLLLLVLKIQVKAQAPSEEEIFRLVIEQKKSTDPKDALPFIKAPGQKSKYYLGHYTSLSNDECIVVCPLQQGRNYLQFVLLLIKNKQGYWQNGGWYYENIYRLKTQDLNKDSIKELIIETKDIAANRVFGKYKIISLINLNEKIWYENNTLMGANNNSDYKNTSKGIEITRDIKVTIIDSINNKPSLIKERTTIGYFNSFSDTTGLKLDYKTKTKEFKFENFKYLSLD